MYPYLALSTRHNLLIYCTFLARKPIFKSEFGIRTVHYKPSTLFIPTFKLGKRKLNCVTINVYVGVRLCGAASLHPRMDIILGVCVSQQHCDHGHSGMNHIVVVVVVGE